MDTLTMLTGAALLMVIVVALYRLSEVVRYRGDDEQLGGPGDRYVPEEAEQEEDGE
jgi:hypothetical protein